MARGGKRQGTPGKGYSNRTDLLTNRQDAGASPFTPASGGVAAPQQAAPRAPGVYPEDVPKLNDPTSRPNEPVTAGLWRGAGPGPEALGAMPPDPVTAEIEAAYALMPTPELRNVIRRFKAKGKL